MPHQNGEIWFRKRKSVECGKTLSAEYTRQWQQVNKADNDKHC